MLANLLAVLAFLILALLCLPTLRTQWGVVSVYSKLLRLSLWLVVTAAAIAWFRPEWAAGWVAQLPPALQAVLPDPRVPTNVLAWTAAVVLVVLPVLALLDVCRKRLVLAEELVVTPTEVTEKGTLPRERQEVRTAVDKMAAISNSPRPHRRLADFMR